MQIRNSHYREHLRYIILIQHANTSDWVGLVEHFSISQAILESFVFNVKYRSPGFGFSRHNPVRIRGRIHRVDEELAAILYQPSSTKPLDPPGSAMHPTNYLTLKRNG